MKVLKYIIMALTLLNLPMVFFFYVSQSISTVMSYATYALILVYYLLNKGGKPNLWLLVLGISYFLIAGINFYSGTEREYYTSFIKYIIIIFCGVALVRKISVNELYFFLFIGAISPIIHAIWYPDSYGRYSGLYYNPNMAGFIAIIAYTLTFKMKNIAIRSFAQILTTLGGLVTFSRTFIVIWLLINLISLKISFKNVRIFAVGFGLLIVIVSFGELFNLNMIRLKKFNAILNEQQGAIQSANEDSRTETWAIYYDYVKEKPIFGNGFGSFQASGYSYIGAHNSFLLVLGEAGILPLIFFIVFCLYLIIKGFKIFETDPYIIMQAIAFTLFMLTCHNLFTTEYVLILILWIYEQIRSKTQEKNQMVMMIS
jgi:O-antigen ligase